MPATLDRNTIRALPVPQRIELVQEILDTIAADPSKEELDEELVAEWNRRVAAYRANPSAAKPWDVVNASLKDAERFMTRPIVLWLNAEDESRDSREYYDRRPAGVGELFVDEVDRVFQVIAAHPKIHALVHRDIRKSIVDRFPFCIDYLVEPSEIAIISVFHTSRDPQIWKARRGP